MAVAATALQPRSR